MTERADPSLRPPRTVLTVGHSDLELEAFVALLAAAGVEVLVDVRSRPATPFLPRFDKRRMVMRLYKAGVVYFFQGDRLGPVGAAGAARGEAHERSRDFQAALDWVQARARESTVCLLGSRADPSGCHRGYLLAQALLARGVPVAHLWPDGTQEKASPDLLHWEAAARAARRS